LFTGGTYVKSLPQHNIFKENNGVRNKNSLKTQQTRTKMDEGNIIMMAFSSEQQEKMRAAAALRRFMKRSFSDRAHIKYYSSLFYQQDPCSQRLHPDE